MWSALDKVDQLIQYRSSKKRKLEEEEEDTNSSKQPKYDLVEQLNIALNGLTKREINKLWKSIKTKYESQIKDRNKLICKWQGFWGQLSVEGIRNKVYPILPISLGGTAKSGTETKRPHEIEELKKFMDHAFVIDIGTHFLFRGFGMKEFGRFEFLTATTLDLMITTNFTHGGNEIIVIYVPDGNVSGLPIQCNKEASSNAESEILLVNPCESITKVTDTSVVDTVTSMVNEYINMKILEDMDEEEDKDQIERLKTNPVKYAVSVYTYNKN